MLTPQRLRWTPIEFLARSHLSPRGLPDSGLLMRGAQLFFETLLGSRRLVPPEFFLQTLKSFPEAQSRQTR